jgi:hypothetical protein
MSRRSVLISASLFAVLGLSLLLGLLDSKTRDGSWFNPVMADEPTPPLKLTLVRLEQAGQRSIFLGPKENHHSQFHVVVTNVSSEPERLWDDRFSWGYGNLSFESMDDEGRHQNIVKKARSWWGNVPACFVLQPNELLVIDVVFDPKVWELPFPQAAIDKPQQFKLRAVYEIRPDKQSDKEKVWTGKIVSPWGDYAIWDRRR